MAKRFTDTDKWKDPWFRGLTPAEKLLFNYLCDNCDLAGFYEVDFAMISFTTKLEEKDIREAFKGLKKGYDGKDGWIWVINFLKHQKNLPLNPENNAHKHIINLIAAQLNRFPDIPKKLGASEGLFSPIGKGIDKGKVRVKVKAGEIKTENSLEILCFEFKEKYAAPMIQDFIRHWDEKNKKGIAKWQLEKTWETDKRLATWYNNSLKWDKTKPETSEQPTVYKGNFYKKK